jgi:hypothetical protein
MDWQEVLGGASAASSRPADSTAALESEDWAGIGGAASFMGGDQSLTAGARPVQLAGSLPTLRKGCFWSLTVDIRDRSGHTCRG